jgi:ATP-binding cassette, subfamily B, bacterial PglK
MINKILEMMSSKEILNAIFMVFLMIIGMLFEALGIGLILPAINLLMYDDFLQEYPQMLPIVSWLGYQNKNELIIGGFTAISIIFFMKFIFSSFSLWWQMKFVYTFQANLSARILNSYLKQPYEFHLSNNSSKLIRNTITEVAEFVARVLIPGIQLISESLVVFGIVILLSFFEPTGTLFTFGVVFVLSWMFYRVIKGYLLVWGKARQYHEGKKIQHVQQALGAIKAIKLLGREQSFFDMFNFHNIESSEAIRKRSTVIEFPRFWLEFLAIFGLTILVTVMLNQGADTKEVMAFIGLFAVAVFRILPSANRILNSMQSLRFGINTLDELHKDIKSINILSGSNNNTFVTKSISANSSKDFNCLLLDNVSYSYPDSNMMAVKSINLSIKSGQTIGIIGGSGSGKSTLINLILSLLVPTKGNIQCDGIDINNDVISWRGSVGYVPQNIYLTDDSIKNNITLGLKESEIDMSMLLKTVKESQLEALISSLPDGLETAIGERGTKLSVGQCQRIGIARALYNNPSLLVLDEATSALDEETESFVMDSINKMHGKKTIIIIAHRLTTLSKCNVIYRLDNGELIERTSYKELIKK